MGSGIVPITSSGVIGSGIAPITSSGVIGSSIAPINVLYLVGMHCGSIEARKPFHCMDFIITD